MNYLILWIENFGLPNEIICFYKGINLPSDCNQLMVDSVSNILAKRMQCSLDYAWACMICRFGQDMLQPHMACSLKIYWQKKSTSRNCLRVDCFDFCRNPSNVDTAIILMKCLECWQRIKRMLDPKHLSSQMIKDQSGFLSQSVAHSEGNTLAMILNLFPPSG